MELNLFQEEAQAHGRFQKEDIVLIKECMEICDLRERGKYAKTVASLIGGTKYRNYCQIHFRTSTCTHCNPRRSGRNGREHATQTLNDDEKTMRLAA
jgi:hypothetical protein